MMPSSLPQRTAGPHNTFNPPHNDDDEDGGALDEPERQPGIAYVTAAAAAPALKRFASQPVLFLGKHLFITK